MKVYIANIVINLKLTLRDRVVLFFNYFFPLVFFFIFAETWDAQQGGAITQVATMVLIIGVLGSGFFGAGIRAVQDRELNILRRFKVAPISPAPLLVSSMVTGWLHFLPAAVLILGLSKFLYGMALPEQWPSLFILLSLGILSFRAVGLIIASVVNTAQESQILIQLLYLPMLFLSGATFPVSALPESLQIVAQFMPATYLYTGLQSIMLHNESLASNWVPAAGLAVTALLALLLGVKLFRWEKGEKASPTAKLWLLAVLAPFLIIGGYQAYSRDNVDRAKSLWRDLLRSRTLLVRNARIFTGTEVIPTGAVLVKEGKIAEVFSGYIPDPASLKAEPVEAAGKTILPGLIDANVILTAPGGFLEEPAVYQPRAAMLRALAAYLYSGVTGVRTFGTPLPLGKDVQTVTSRGTRLGAEVFLCGPLFTPGEAQATGYLNRLPANIREVAIRQMTRTPGSADEARAAVRALGKQGVNSVKASLDSSGAGGRLDLVILRAMADEARALGIPLFVRTADARDVADAVAAGANAIEHGSYKDAIPPAVFAEMTRRGVAYLPALSAAEAMEDLRDRRTALLTRSLVQQVGPAALIESTRKSAESGDRSGRDVPDSRIGRENLLAAYKAGVMLVAASDAGTPMVLHGPTVQHEMQLWVQAGIPPEAALRAATVNAARLLGAADRIGAIEKGREASLLIVDGDPLQDISAAERISMVIFRGERIDRTELLQQR
jgi:imidazolonepropionase-like amidohydrolase/ABC-type multidrug transport system permease subunit